MKYHKTCRKKGQIKIMETVGVLAVFFVLLMVGLVLWNAYHEKSLERQALEQKKQRAIEHALMVTFLPEIQCESNGIPREHCIDLEKLNAFASNSNSLFYVGLFAYSNITVSYVQLPDFSETTVELYSKENPAMQSALATQIPVTVYDPKTRQSFFGVVSIDYFY